MSLFDSLNRPGWQHKNPTVRLDAVDQLDDPEVLVELSSTDPDPAVRARALSRISNPDTLDTLIDTLPTALQKQAKAQRLAQLLPDPEQIATIDNDAVLIRIAGLTDDPQLLTAAITRLRNDELRLDIASEHPLARVRLHAAQGIRDIELLDRLLHHARGHDKAVYRHCKTLLDEYHCRQREEAECREKVQQLTQKAEDLAKAVDSPEYKGRYQLLVQQWPTVNAWANPTQEKQFQHHLAICRDRLSDLSAIQVADKQRQADLANANQLFEALIAELKVIDQSTPTFDDPATIRQLSDLLDELEKRWHTASKSAPCTPEQSKLLHKYVKRWRSLLKTAQSLIDRKPALEKVCMKHTMWILPTTNPCSGRSGS